MDAPQNAKLAKYGIRVLKNLCLRFDEAISRPQFFIEAFEIIFKMIMNNQDEKILKYACSGIDKLIGTIFRAGNEQLAAFLKPELRQ